MPLLLARTHYSLLTAPASPQVLCEEAVRLGLSHLVLSDTNGLYGLYPFAQAARRVGLQAVFGAELVHRGRRACRSERTDGRVREFARGCVCGRAPGPGRMRARMVACTATAHYFALSRAELASRRWYVRCRAHCV